MPLQLHNSLTKSLEPVVPLQPGALQLYACGVTVYDDAHLGHIRAAFAFEVLRRVAQAQGWKVTYVRNITDVDDKIIDKARGDAEATGESLKTACRQVAARYTERYHRDLERMNIPPPDLEPCATEHIPQMIQLIKGLLAKGHAYASGGDVYYRVRSWPAYGRLSHQSVDELRAGAPTRAGARIAPGEGKEDPLDFALWKTAKPDEPSWDSPWGPGRPGWHIECSAMSMTYLGETFDVHGGGRDLLFPHHENEIAQSEASTGRPFARCWVHSGLVTVQGQKMAKSIGNVINIDQLLARHANPDVLKLLLLMTHYASPLDFTWETYDEAATAYAHFTTIFDTVEAAQNMLTTARPTVPLENVQAAANVAQAERGFKIALENDLNTPVAVSALFALASFAHREFESGRLRMASAIADQLRKHGRTLGLFEQLVSRSVPPNVRELVDQRNAARWAKDFKKADQLRQEIQKHGFIVEDTGGGTVCRPA